MNLVKWLRKNNTKVMAVVVIALMFVFVGGTALERLLMSGRSDLHKVVAYFADDRKITNYDLIVARQELEVLRMLQADTVLKGSIELAVGVLDLKALLLGELLFSERTASPALIANIRQMIRRNEYRISDKQINDIYRRSMPGEIYWLLLSKEAERAGIRISNDQAKARLAGIYARNPDVFRGATYARVIGAIVDRRGIPEDQILDAYARLIAVTEYAKLVCSMEDLTIRQVRHNLSSTGETVDVEFVRFDSSIFAEDQPEPNEYQVNQHFRKYKSVYPGTVSNENPYGFGYRYFDRIGLEYLALKLDDVSQTVEKPTQQEVEQYYQKNRSRFVEQVPDPNDPDAPLIERTRSYAEVAVDISDMLLRQRANSRAELILHEAMTLTEATSQNTPTTPDSLSPEQLRQMAGDYKSAAEQLSRKYEVKLYAGQTGLLNGTEMRTDEYLARLYVRAFGFNVVRLPQVVFAIDEIGTSEIGPFDVPKPGMYENIGPVRDFAEQVMAIVRITQAEKASDPNSVNETISKATFRLEATADSASPDDSNRPQEPAEANDVYSVRRKVVEDLKRLAAMDTTKAKAEEFKVVVANQGWDEALDTFNQLYGKVEPNLADANDPASLAQKTFRLQQLSGLSRIPKLGLATFATLEAGSPDANVAVHAVEREAVLRDTLYSLVPPDSNSLDAVPHVLEFKPDLSCYCLKSVGVNRISRDQYESAKVERSFKADFIQSQSLAPVFFNPENIVKRMKFRPVSGDTEPADANMPDRTEGTS
ncbi:MAG: hypothetical protein ACYST6_13445 [Planctomycetota bacterium]|jgi:hypothetical protein